MSKVLNNTPSRVEIKHKILEKANEALRDKLHVLTQWYADEARYSLVSRWKFGAEILDVIRDGTIHRGRRYKPGAFRSIALYFNEDEATLRQLSHLAEQFSEEEITQIAEMRMADGITRLTYTHVRILSGMADKAQRQDALKKTVDNCLNTEQLSEYIQTTFGCRSTNPHGRAGKAGTPKDALGIVRQQLAFCQDLEQRHLAVWHNDKTGLKAQLERLPAIPDELIKTMQETVVKLEAAEVMLRANRDELESALVAAQNRAPATAVA